MQKIKFKIAYKPLTTEQVNKHKDFDALMGMYAAVPKLNFFQKLFKNKWTMFSTGILIGGLIATVIALNSNKTDQPIQLSQNDQIISQNKNIDTENNSPSLSIQQTITPIENRSDEAPVLTEQSKDLSLEQENHLTQEKKDNALSSSKSTEKNDIKNQSDISFAELNKSEPQFPGVQIEAIGSEKLPAQENIEPVQSVAVATLKIDDTQKQQEIILAKSDINSARNTANNLNNTLSDEQSVKIVASSPIAETTIPAQPDSLKSLTNAVVEIATMASKIENKANAFFEQVVKEKNKNRDTISAENNLLDSTNVINPSTASAPSEFKNRYAQLSFFTPISSNGMEGYKYYHHFSVNMIQGYNGALQGLEVGGVINAEKGYAIGGQFAGVGNVIGGDLTGIQGAGVFNFAKSVKGMQYAGVANYSNRGMYGMQGAGVANYSGGKMEGMQAAGVINIASGTTYESKLIQTAGVANIATSQNFNGVQISGVINAANTITGAQIGLINAAKKVNGTQIGLINIADTIDGVAIGLLSFSRNGIFDVDLYTSDLFRANLAVRFGTPYVYNTFAFGITPAADTLKFGYGLGIGGHIPLINKIAVDIDGMIWSTFEEEFDFTNNQLHLMNQLRILPSYSFNKYLSVFAGPVINVEVYDNSYDPLKENTFASFNGSNVTTALSLGYVVGIRFF